jgi:uncharacterized protein
MRICIDTSALVKRYVAFQGGAEVQALFEQANSVHIAHHCRLDLHSAFNRMRLTKQITPTVYRACVAEFEQELADFDVAPWGAEIDAHALTLLVGSNLRAMDAMHVAAALAVQADRFVTSDERQWQAAKRAKLNSIYIV